MAACCLGKLAAFIIANIAGRCPNQAAYTMFFHVLAHVDTNHRVCIIKKELGQCTGEFGFTHPGRSQEKNKVKLSVPDTVKGWLAERGYDPVYGARPLKRVIQQNITNTLATQLLMRENEGTVEFEASITTDGQHITFVEIVNDVEEWVEGD